MTAFSYTNPTVGGSEDTWGETLNANWTALGNFIGPLDSTELAVLDGITATTAELNYVDGVTSAIQTQLDAKSTASATETLTNKTITAPTISAPTINGAVSGDSLSTQAEAEAGTNNDQLMTPLRTAQAIDALAGGGAELLGTLNTTSGSTYSLTGLNLTSYNWLRVDISNLQYNYHFSTATYFYFQGLVLFIMNNRFTATGANLDINLSSGLVVWDTNTNTTEPSGRMNIPTLSNASTSFTFTLSAPFAAGTIKVYGIK